MSRGILDVRLAAVLFIFLVGSVSLINVNQRVEANQVLSKASCSSCSSSDVKVLNATVLEGEDKNKAVAAALSSEDYKNVKKLFPESVYEPIRENATAGIINLEFNYTKYEVLAVFVPFEAEAGLLAAIVFSIIKGHTIASGAVVDLQYETPIFAAMSMDGKASQIPLQWSSPCCSCGSGVSPMVYECDWDTDCYELYGPDYCCASGQCVYCECWSDYDCQQKIGEGWCCVNRQCQPCPPPPPPEPPTGCKVMDDWCFLLHKLACIAEYGLCMYFCQPKPQCWAGCLTYYFICYAKAYYDCCLEWW